MYTKKYLKNENNFFDRMRQWDELLHGKEQEFNSNAFQRGVAIHGAKYVSEKFIRKNGRLGRSFGCPAIDESINVDIINSIKNGSCLFIYHPNKQYISKSEFLTIDTDLLNI